MARKHLLSDLAVPKAQSTGEGEATGQDLLAPQYAPRGAIGAVSRSIELLKSQSLTDLDPDLIDAPSVIDRLDEDGEQFEEFARNIRENGQQVPIRPPSPDQRRTLSNRLRTSATSCGQGCRAQSESGRQDDDGR